MSGASAPTRSERIPVLVACIWVRLLSNRDAHVAEAIPAGPAWRTTEPMLVGRCWQQVCSTPGVTAKLTHACVITTDLRTLRDFYATLLAMPPQTARDDYVEFATAAGALSFYLQSKLEPY